MSTQTFYATGLTCGHCAAAVTEELSALAGVEGVDVTPVRDG
ncbi:MAG: heavy-metal-associated domain-containing protein, partial [Dietzia sp.]|nr:heavy-metal-associated domain-containing protein [Dietzia sp.]